MVVFGFTRDPLGRSEGSRYGSLPKTPFNSKARLENLPTELMLMITDGLDTVAQLLALRHTSRALYNKVSSHWLRIHQILRLNSQAKYMLIARQLGDWVLSHPDNQVIFRTLLKETTSMPQLLRFCNCTISPKLTDIETLPAIHPTVIKPPAAIVNEHMAQYPPTSSNKVVNAEDALYNFCHYCEFIHHNVDLWATPNHVALSNTRPFTPFDPQTRILWLRWFLYVIRISSGNQKQRSRAGSGAEIYPLRRWLV